MKFAAKLSIVPVLFGTVLMSAAPADAWTRNSATTGPNGGTVSSQGSGSCYGGSCSSQQSFTGRYGNTYTRRGSTHCQGYSCTGGATYTGPNGGTIKRQRNLNW